MNVYQRHLLPFLSAVLLLAGCTNPIQIASINEGTDSSPDSEEIPNQTDTYGTDAVGEEIECTWEQFGQGNRFLAIWGSSSDNVYVAGADAVDNATISRWDGANWLNISDDLLSAIQIFIPGAQFTDIWGASASMIFVNFSFPLGGGNMIYNGDLWNYTGFADTLSLNPQAIWGSSSTDVFSVGSLAIHHYDGSTWESMGTMSGQNFLGIWGNASDDVFAVGESGLVTHYDGANWQEENMGSLLGSHSINDAWSSSKEDFYIVSSDPDGLGGKILKHDGSSWSNVDLGIFGIDTSFYAIWGNGPDDILVVGENVEGGILIHYNGETWYKINCDYDFVFRDVWAEKNGDLFVAGEEGGLRCRRN